MIRPIGNRVALRVIPVDRVTGGGIHIAETIVRADWRGTVLAVGPGKVDSKGKVTPIPVNVGDVVTFAKGAGVKWDSGDGEVLIANADALTGVIQE